MSGAGPVLILFVFLAVLAAAMIINYQLATKRRSEMSAVALQLSWEWDPGVNPDLDDEFSQFGCFTTGGDREAMNTISGRLLIADRRYPAQMGDYKFTRTQSNGKTTTKTTHRFSYALVQLPFPVPDLLIRRESILDKAKSFLGFEDINFESAEFSRKFFVKGPDKKFAYDVIHPEMMEFLLRNHTPTLELGRGWLLVLDGERCWRPAEFLSRVSWLEQFFELWPDFLIRQLESA